MRNIRLDIAYDGTSYAGFQRQKDKLTIQGELEKRLSDLYKEQIKVVASGRTDAGVHALNQVSSYKSSKMISPQTVKKALNGSLDGSIRVIKAIEVSECFHARYSAKAREYKYVIHDGDYCPPFIRGYVLYVKKRIDEEHLLEILRVFEGAHDFASFTVGSPEQKDTKRIIESINLERLGDEISIYIKANGFLRKMVRMLIGGTLYLTLGGVKDGVLRAKEVLSYKDRALNKYPTSPAHGLYLNKVYY